METTRTRQSIHTYAVLAVRPRFLQLSSAFASDPLATVTAIQARDATCQPTVTVSDVLTGA